MTTLADTLAILAAAANLVAGLYGAFRWYVVAPSRLFWVLLRSGQVAAVALAAGAGVIAADGRHHGSGLFYLYALLPIPVSFVAEQFRLLSAQTVLEARGLEDARALGERPREEQASVVLQIVRRELGIMALSALVVAFLALRALGTA